MNDLPQDEKERMILQLLEDGKSKDEVSQHFEQDWKTLYVYMNRRGYRWDSELETFIMRSEMPDAEKQWGQTLNTKASQIIRMLDVKQPNIQKVAVKQGFSTITELGSYMKAQGFLWKDDLQNYVENQTVPSQEDVKITSGIVSGGGLDEQNLMQFLLQHQEQLMNLLSDSETMSIPTYKFKGNKVNKTLTLASSAAALLEDFHKENNLTQRSIIEVALAEFFIRHGYKEKMGAMML